MVSENDKEVGGNPKKKEKSIYPLFLFYKLI